MAPPGEGAARYRQCRAELTALLAGESDLIARMASATSVLKRHLPKASFIGFYRVLEPDLLVVGPYQGPPACLRIRFGQGVCGTAAQQNRSQLVADVHTFPGHIACDSEARSELVVPVRNASGAVMAVLDLDSRLPAAFDEEDQLEMEELMELCFTAPNPGWNQGPPD